METNIKNKELVKLKIIEEFNRKDSPVRNLLTPFKNFDWQQERNFLCSEFGLCISVERIRHDNRFQVLFTELSELKPKPSKKLIDLSDNKSLSKTKHAIEEMHIFKDSIGFHLDKGTIIQNDYNFVIDGKSMHDLISFDFGSGKFSYDSIDNIHNFIQACMGRGLHYYYRHKFVPTPSDIQEINNTDWFKRLKPDTQQKVVEVLEGSYDDHDTWFFYKFINLLFNHGSDFES